MALYDYDEETGKPIRAEYEGDGWEEVDMIPSDDEYKDAWASYYNHIASTGDDPLGVLCVDVLATQTHTWQARFQNWVGNRPHGVAFLGARRRGRGPWLRAADLPEEVIEYLGIQPVNTRKGIWVNPDYHNTREMAKEVTPQRGHGLMFTFTVSETRSRSGAVVRRERRREAREAIARAKGGEA